MKVDWLNRQMLVGPFLALVLSEAEFHRAMDDCKIARSLHGDWIKTATAHGTLHSFDAASGPVCIVALRLPQEQSAIQIAGILVHEAVHVWQFFRERIGETSPSSEFEAYAIQHIAQQLMDSFGKRVAAGTVPCLK